MKKLFLEWDQTGRNITALCFYAFAVVAALFTGIIGTRRLLSAYYMAAGAYLTLSAGALCLSYCVIRYVQRGEIERVNACSYPLVVGGFIFGLSALFFVDGGTSGGVPMFFILAIVTTPCFMETRESAIMLILEFLAFGSNVYLSFRYPDAVDPELAKQGYVFIPMVLVTAALGVLFLLYSYAYRHQQVKLDKALRDANVANEAKSRFLDNMSHEIRTPMNSILGMNEMILREEDRPEIAEYALAIQRSGRALLGLINDILDFSQLQDNRMELILVRYDLSSLVNDMANMAAQSAREKSLTLNIHINKDIPRILEGDEYHIRQVILNILSNAVKFTQKGSVTFTMDYERSGEDSILLNVSVADTGIGIKEEDLGYIFQPFEQIDSTRTLRSDGSGLGLAIVRNLLRLMGSELKVESAFRQGSTFSFKIQQKVIKWEPVGDYDHAFSVAAAHQAGYHESFQAPDARVLVVDDTDVNLLVFTNLLKKTKIRIDTANSGMEMLQMARANRYDIIFLDHRMPGMDGVEAFHAMKKLSDNLNENTPVIALTANAVLGARQMYISEGFSDYISKPVDTVRLEHILLQYLPPELVHKGEPGDGMEAETAPEALQEADSPYAHIPGIDYGAAVANCGGEDTFVKALEIFYTTLDQRADDIERYAAEKDVRNYTILVHALKSAARLVGALDLSAAAKHLEESGDKEDLQEIEAKTPDLLFQYRSYKETLASIFGEQDEEELPEMSIEDLHELYEALRELAEMFDLDNIDTMMERASKYRIPDAEREKFEKVKDCITAADWGALEELL